MGFDFSKYDSGGDWIKAAEKKVIAESGIPVRVIKIVEEEENRFDQPRFVLTVEVPDPETGEDAERKIGFPIGSGVESRDRLLYALMAHIDETNEQVDVKFEKIGQSYLIRSAEGEA